MYHISRRTHEASVEACRLFNVPMRPLKHWVLIMDLRLAPIKDLALLEQGITEGAVACVRYTNRRANCWLLHPSHMQMFWTVVPSGTVEALEALLISRGVLTMQDVIKLKKGSCGLKYV